MINVIKIGGNVVDNPEALKGFLGDLASLGGNKILVHGGGKEASRLSKALSIPTQMIEGRRVTDAATLDVVTMVYAGLINKRIVAMLQGLGCNSIGLCGADGETIVSHRRSPEPVDYGFVGDIDRVNAGFLASLLERGITPVICAITYDGHGGLLNSNADGVASAVAQAMATQGKTDLTYCFEKPGVLADVDDENSVIASIDSAGFVELKEKGVIADGMIPKIDNALKAVKGGVNSVIIKSAANLLKETATTITL